MKRLYENRGVFRNPILLRKNYYPQGADIFLAPPPFFFIEMSKYGISLNLFPFSSLFFFPSFEILGGGARASFASP